MKTTTKKPLLVLALLATIAGLSTFSGCKKPEQLPTACFTESINNTVVNTAITFTNCSNSATTYLWNFGDGQTSTIESPTHTYTTAGTYSVELTANNSDGSNSVTRSIVVGRSITYALKAKDVLGVSGTVTFSETSATITTITIQLTGASATNHPPHIHANSAIEGGAIKLSLNPVNSQGISVTEVSELDDNTPINYSQLIAYDGYLNVHESSSQLGTIIAQGDIGGNELTGTEKSYTIDAVNQTGVSGTALFQRRKNGTTLVTLSLSGTIAGAEHPAHIHLGSVSTVGGGPITASLTNVDGTTGRSYTNLRTLDNATAITYNEWLAYDGYINIHNSPIVSTEIAQGNIGSNAQ